MAEKMKNDLTARTQGQPETDSKKSTDRTRKKKMSQKSLDYRTKRGKKQATGRGTNKNAGKKREPSLNCG